MVPAVMSLDFNGLFALWKCVGVVKAQAGWWEWRDVKGLIFCLWFSSFTWFCVYLYAFLFISLTCFAVLSANVGILCHLLFPRPAGSGKPISAPWRLLAWRLSRLLMIASTRTQLAPMKSGTILLLLWVTYFGHFTMDCTLTYFLTSYWLPYL